MIVGCDCVQKKVNQTRNIHTRVSVKKKKKKNDKKKKKNKKSKTAKNIILPLSFASHQGSHRETRQLQQEEGLKVYMGT